MNNLKEVDAAKKLSDIVMFDGSSNVQLGARLLKVNYQKITVICGVEHTVSLFFHHEYKITIVCQMISPHKVICNIFGSGIYHKTHSMFKLKPQEIHNKNIGIFSGNDTSMAWYFMGMHRGLQIKCSSIHHIVCIIQQYSYKKNTKAVR